MPLKWRHSTIALFADDSKCYRRITKVQNCQELQDDINHLFKWSVEWGMSFKIEKCFVLFINQSNQHQPFKYTMSDVTLSTVNEVKDLGIFLDTKLSWDKHIRYTTANARKLTGLIKRTVGHSAPVSVLQQLYSSIVMPQLEYATPVWNSLSKSQIQTLERIQRSYTKFMFGYESPLTYPDRLDRLNMLPLSYRRDISDLCQLYKFIQDPRPLPPDSVHFRNDQRCTRQSESSNFPIPRCKTEQSRKFYFNRVVYSWNKLPESVKSASTLLGFKKSLTTYFNDILESNFNVNNICTWAHICKCALCRQCS